MFIWVVGSSGMLGRALVDTLQEKKIPFIATNKEQANITDRNALESVLLRFPHITHIINCAAYTAVDLAEVNFKQAHQINVEGVVNLAHLAKKYSKGLLLVSSDYVFSGDKTDPYTEKDNPFPINAYGLTKWLSEVEAQKIYENVCIVRTSWLFGPYGKNFVRTMLQLMQEKENISVVSDQWGRPTYTKDLAQILLQLLPLKGIFHYASCEKINWFQFAENILSVANGMNMSLKAKKIIPILSKDYPTKAKRPLYSVLDTNKISQLIPTYQPRSIEDVLKDYIKEDLWELSAK
jgi:dTDP-4-dehydrorhamnose reductase